MLEQIKNTIEAMESLDQKYLKSKGNDNGFELLFSEIAPEIAKSISPPNHLDVHIHFGHHFPDADLTLNGVKYGVELKSRNNGSWKTNGNSVFESITSEDYEEIFLVFASKIPKKNQYLVKYAPYWNTTSTIQVTHSPRFIIDMENSRDSVFESKAEYTSLRTMSESEKIDFLQRYLRENSTGYKWFITPQDTINPTAFRDLVPPVKSQIKAELLILFPDDLICGDHRNKYTRTVVYMLNNYYTYNNSLRDMFSAGGVYRSNGVEFPQTLRSFIVLKDMIDQTITNANEDFFTLAKSKWRENLPEYLITEDFKESYLNILNYLGEIEPLNTQLRDANIDSLSQFIFQ